LKRRNLFPGSIEKELASLDFGQGQLQIKNFNAKAQRREGAV
jgi:hypothetical protein